LINIEFNIEKKAFNFKQPAGTSRGVLTKKVSWFIYLNYSSFVGVGECSIIEGLSPDFISNETYEIYLKKTLVLIKNEAKNFTDIEELKFLFAEDSVFYESTKRVPSIRFGIEMALLNLINRKQNVYFQNDFVFGKKRIPINGLVWMGDFSFMKSQIDQKIKSGFTTIKLKIGAIAFDEELSLLKAIRKNYNENQITLRVDANGSFSVEKIDSVLEELSKLKIHSIEQPIKPGQYEKMSLLSAKPIVGIALDEELIPIYSIDNKKSLLKKILPQYIILKPSLHGGIKGCNEWISIAKSLNIKWWLTSALESNVGLNAICQYASEYNISLPQGLGTGALYENNIPSKLKVKDGYIFYNI